MYKRQTKKKREIIVTNNETGETKTYLIPYGSRIKIMDGAVLELSLIHISVQKFVPVIFW